MDTANKSSDLVSINWTCPNCGKDFHWRWLRNEMVEGCISMMCENCSKRTDATIVTEFGTGKYLVLTSKDKENSVSLVICNKVDTCETKDVCFHSKPHMEDDTCSLSVTCDGKCIPVFKQEPEPEKLVQCSGVSKECFHNGEKCHHAIPHEYRKNDCDRQCWHDTKFKKGSVKCVPVKTEQQPAPTLNTAPKFDMYMLNGLINAIAVSVIPGSGAPNFQQAKKELVDYITPFLRTTQES